MSAAGLPVGAGPPNGEGDGASSVAPPARIRWVERLGVKLTVAVAGVTLATMGAVVYVAAREQNSQLIGEAVRGAALFSDTIRSSTHDHMLLDQKGAAYRIMQGIGRQEGIDKVRIFNKEGRITFSTAPKETGTLVDKKAESCYACHAAGKPLERLSVPSRSRVYRAPQGHRVLGMVTPIYNEAACSEAECHVHPPSQSVLGVVDIGISLEEIDSRIARLTRATVGLGAGAVLLVALLVLFTVGRFVLRPVGDLVAATVRLGHLDYGSDIRVRTDDELGVLARSFNDMKASLFQARKERLLLLASLERKVEERTAELKAAQARLVQTEKLASLGKLSASIAHEINNPLAGILTFAKVLIRTMESGTPDDAGRTLAVKNLKLIQRETERCTVIVRNLLDFARERPLELKEMDVNGPLEEALSLALHKIELQGIALEKRLGPPATVKADFGQLRQSFVNVLLNACDAMPKGGKLTVESRTDVPARRAEVLIADSGAGIPPEIIGRIFDPFFSTKEKGTGLGLSVVYGIIEKHGGTLDVESKVGTGTRMTFRLPLAAPGAKA